MGPDNLEGPSHIDVVLLVLREDKSNVFSFKNIGWGGIGPNTVESPSHILAIVMQL